MVKQPIASSKPQPAQRKILVSAADGMPGHILRHQIITVSSLISGSRKQIVFKGTKAQTNNQTIILPNIDPMTVYSRLDANILRGYTAHESAHCRYTDFALIYKEDLAARTLFSKITKSSPEIITLAALYKKLCNIIDDRLIENKVRKEFIGTYAWLADLRRSTSDARLRLINSEPQTRTNAFINALLCACELSNDWPSSRQADETLEIIAQSYPDLEDASLRWEQTIRGIDNEPDIYLYAHELMAEFLSGTKLPPLPETKSQDTQGEDYGDSGTPPPDDNEPSNSENGPGEDGDIGGSPGRPTNGPASDDQANPPPAEHQSEPNPDSDSDQTPRSPEKPPAQTSHDIEPPPADRNELEKDHEATEPPENSPDCDKDPLPTTEPDDTCNRAPNNTSNTENDSESTVDPEQNQNSASDETTDDSDSPETQPPIEEPQEENDTPEQDTSDSELDAAPTVGSGRNNPNHENPQTDSQKLQRPLSSEHQDNLPDRQNSEGESVNPEQANTHTPIELDEIDPSHIKAAVQDALASLRKQSPREIDISETERHVEKAAEATNLDGDAPQPMKEPKETLRRIVKGDSATPSIIDGILEIDVSDMKPDNHLYVRIIGEEDTEIPLSTNVRGRNKAHLSAARIKPLLLSQRNDSSRTKLTDGTLDHNNVIGLSIGDPDVFKRRTHAPRINTALQILIDQSYSTRTIIRLIAEISKSLADLSLGIPELKTAISSFTSIGSDQFRGITLITHIKKFDHGPSQSQERYLHWTNAPLIMNGTPTAQATLACARHLEARRERRKILCVITDGEPDDMDLAVEANYHLRSRGIENCVLEIGEQFMPHTAYEHSAVAQGIADVPAAMTKLFKALLTTPY